MAAVDADAEVWAFDGRVQQRTGEPSAVSADPVYQDGVELGARRLSEEAVLERRCCSFQGASQEVEEVLEAVSEAVNEALPPRKASQVFQVRVEVEGLAAVLTYSAVEHLVDLGQAPALKRRVVLEQRRLVVQRREPTDSIAVRVQISFLYQ